MLNLGRRGTASVKLTMDAITRKLARDLEEMGRVLRQCRMTRDDARPYADLCREAADQLRTLAYALQHDLRVVRTAGVDPSPIGEDRPAQSDGPTPAGL